MAPPGHAGHVPRLSGQDAAAPAKRPARRPSSWQQYAGGLHCIREKKTKADAGDSSGRFRKKRRGRRGVAGELGQRSDTGLVESEEDGLFRKIVIYL